MSTSGGGGGSTGPLVCCYCSRECKSIDSRPHSGPKSAERIHNKCRLKLAVSGKAAKKPVQFGGPSVAERLARDRDELKRSAGGDSGQPAPGSTKAVEKPQTQFFFDLKAGTVPAEEKRRYLRHAKLTDFVARYDQDGFQQEALGRTYDASGSNLSVLEDEADLELEARLPKEARRAARAPEESCSSKRKLEPSSTTAKLDKRLAQQRHKCWFCLDSSEADLELVVGRGRHCYLALAKGGLTNDHLLLVPLKHVGSIRSEANSPELLQELELFKASLVDFYGAQQKAVVFYERNLKSFHWQLQVVPVPHTRQPLDQLVSTIKRISVEHYESINFAPSTSKQYSLRDVIPTETTPYFSWELRSAQEPSVELISLIDSRATDFPIQFGRLVLAHEDILNCPQKVDWKTCDKSPQDYQKLVLAKKQALAHLFH